MADLVHDNEVTGDVRGTYDPLQEDDRRRSQVKEKGACYYGGTKQKIMDSGEILKEKAKDARVIPCLDEEKDLEDKSRDFGDKVKGAFQDFKEKVVEVGEKVKETITGSEHKEKKTEEDM